MSENVIDKVISRIYGHGRGWVFVPSDFSDIANPATIRSALSRIIEKGKIRRIMRGVYDGPYRSYEWFGNTLKFKHRTNKETSILSYKTALIVQALKALGEKNVDYNVITVISNHLDKKERAKILKEAMHVTSWIYEMITKACQLDIHKNSGEK